MSLATVKSAMATVLDGITGIDTDHVFVDEPNTTPTKEGMPCLLVTLPRITPTAPYQGIVKCVYHFEILYLYAPYELTQPATAATAIDGYLGLVWDALFGAFTLSANAVTQDFDGDVTRPLVRFRDAWYWGIRIPWRVEDRTSATFTA
jgi:hypothetical protein